MFDSFYAQFTLPYKERVKLEEQHFKNDLTGFLSWKWAPIPALLARS
jgi:hypothetical protein